MARVLPVRSAAYSALTIILNTTQFAGQPKSDQDDWENTAVSIRAYWNKYQNLSQVERWYQVLGDDRATQAQWLEAASSITCPTTVDMQPGNSSPLSRSFGRGGDARPEKQRLRGEALRAKSSPSVTALLEKRTKAVSDGSTAVDLALCLSAWDPRAALPTLRKEFERCLTFLNVARAASPPGFDANNNAWHLTELTVARARGKDPHAFAEYSKWLLASPPVFPFDPASALEPIWRYPDDPVLSRAARALFRGRWRPEVQKRAVTLFNDDGLVNSPLLGVAAYREVVYTLLTDRSRAGTVTLGQGGQLSIDTPSSSMSRGDSDLRRPGDPRPNVPVPFRRCDFVAWNLAQINGAPQFQLYWPEKARNATLLTFGPWLRRYAPALRYSDFQEKMADSPISGGAALTFPPLGRPAVPEDVRRCRAIFSLSGKAPVRVAKLPDYPLRARWTALSKYPYSSQEWIESTKQVKTVTRYIRDGWVWQGEEKLTQGHWQRYYGFVGPHEVVRVPANEVEFPEGRYGWSEWKELTGGIDCRLSLAGQDEKAIADVSAPPHFTVPPSIDVQLRNRSGLTRTIPAVWTRKDASGTALRTGVQVRLWHSAQLPTASQAGDPEFEVRRIWNVLSPRSFTTIRSGGSGRVLPPTARFKCATLDLRDWFDLRQPGLYRVLLSFAGGNGAPGTGDSNVLHFVLDPEP